MAGENYYSTTGLTQEQKQGNFSDPISPTIVSPPQSAADANAYQQAQNTNWGTLWNEAWNQGYNNSANTVNPYSGKSGGGYDIGAGYTQGQQQFILDQKNKTTKPADNPVVKTGTDNSGTTTQTTNFDDVFKSNYAGWDYKSAYQDWISKGRPGQTQTGSGSDYDNFVKKNPYSDITPNWNPDDFMSKLDEIYNEAVNYAGKQKQFAEQSRAGNVADIEGQFGVSKGSLDTSKGQAMGTLGQSEISSRQRQEQSLDAIRKLYNEMQMGYNQRFGGASSAGEAARALAGQEQQRQSGTTRQATSDALRQIESQKVQVEQNYGNAIADLENKKNTAINEANRNFQSAILTIDNDIKTAANEKALAKMNLLKEYKTDLFNIKQQAAAWNANLQSMKYQADLQTESALKQLQASSSAGSDALSNLQKQTTINPNTGLQFSGADLTNAALTGQISKDELQGLIGQQSRSDIPAWMQQSGAFNF